MTRSRVLSLLLGLTSLFESVPVVTAGDRIIAIDSQYVAEHRAATAATWEKLATVTVNVDWQETPLGDALKELSEATGIPLIVQEDVLDDELGILLTETVTLRLNDLVAADVLSILLRETVGDLGWYRTGSVVVVTTEVIAAGYTETRVYDVSGLVQLRKPEPKPPLISQLLQPPKSQGFFQFGPGKYEPLPITPAEAYDFAPVLELVETFVQFDHWCSGRCYTPTEIVVADRPAVVLHAPRRGHLIFSDLLEQLRSGVE